MRVKITKSPGGVHTGKYGNLDDPSFPSLGLWVDGGFCERSIHIPDTSGWEWEELLPRAPEPRPKKVFPVSGMKWDKCDENEPFSDAD